jgi:hypothetical protein
MMLPKKTKECEKINLLSHRRVLYIFFSTLTNVDCYSSDNPVVDGTHNYEHEQKINDELHINEDSTGEQNLVEEVPIIVDAMGEQNLDEGGEQNLNT